jgi:small subunit ribosomal protein S9
MPKKINQTNYTYAVGRRKSAVATVKLFKGKGESTVNKINVATYFPQPSALVDYSKPFVVTETQNKYYFQAKVIGGGKEGQLDALVLAISRALKIIDEINFKPLLRTAGLLTVDSRVRERRMVGTGGKARRQKQSPKR